MMNDLLAPSSRIAFSALIHDIGKFAQRADIEISPQTKENNTHIFCPYNAEKKYHSHIHAAYTGIAIDLIEKYLPKINNTDTFPFQIDDKDNSIITASSMHHKPKTYLQHIISTADRLSSAFERTKYDEYNSIEENTNYRSARLIPLFDKISLNNKEKELNYRYPLFPMTPEGIFPNIKTNINKEEAKKEYLDLWNSFIEDVKKLKNQDDWNLWLDNFDTLYSIYTQNIPSSSYKTLADVSLYDHSKTTSALATALWRYHYETNTNTLEALKEDNIGKFLLIQGDVSGIQDFIFESGKYTQKNAYKILRGRSFMVSLFSECAAIKVLEALGLPATSQIMNAAGKFVIVAPNTENTIKQIETVKQELSKWFKSQYLGLVSVGIATISASQKDFEDKNFFELQKKIYNSLSVAKMQKFDLCNNSIDLTDYFDNYQKDKGICCYDGKMPAEVQVANQEEYACRRCIDILSLGENLTHQPKIYISKTSADNGLKMDVMGYYICWEQTEDTIRIWDITLPKNNQTSMFNGYARRYINAYIPRFSKEDTCNSIYQELGTIEEGKVKTFQHLAYKNCIKSEDKIKGKSALMCLKGDIDNLGLILMSGLKNSTFSTMAGLSRQINNFFSVWLPNLCFKDEQAKDIYTVFAGGDDFYLIGPWLDMINIIPKFRQQFEKYVCHNKDITFSAGLCMTRSGEDVLNMSSMAEETLEKAKNYQEGDTLKNAICCFQQVVPYTTYQTLLEETKKLNDYHQKYDLSTGYIYSLLELCEDASLAEKDFTRAMWRSKLVYRTQRFIETNNKIEDKTTTANAIAQDIGTSIEQHKNNYKITLSIWLYQHREN